ncbi:MAG: O-antigen ligase family protein, partial [Candidatus Magasanikbacteria bacterium]|nr:O-antigen ligase family protein [Candidatus Magasanikbacteria bacterium]
MILSKIKNYLLLILLLVLPWQTRLIYKSTYIQNKFWEYGSLSLYSSQILLAVIIIFWIVERLKDDKFRARLQGFNLKRAGIILGVYLLLAFYFFISANRDLAWQYLDWMVYAACFFIVILESEFNFYKISLFVWLGSLLPALLGIYQFFSQSVFGNKWLGLSVQNPTTIGVSVIEYLDERWLRAYGSFGSPNALGIYLGVIFLLGIILVLNSDNHRTRLWLLLGQVVILSALFLSFSRGAWLGVAVGLLILAFQNRKSVLFFQQAAIYGLIAVILSFAFSHLLFARADLDSHLEAKSISERLTQWQDFKLVFSQHWLFGVGPGNYVVALKDLHHSASANYFSPVHNIYLLFVGQLGFFGLGSVIFVGYWLYKKRRKEIKIFAPLSCLLIAGLFDHWTLSMF